MAENDGERSGSACYSATDSRSEWDDLNMYSDFKVRSLEPSAARSKRKGLDILPNPSLAAEGFNIWWQKTAAKSMATVSEASDLMRAHRLARSANQPPSR